MENILDCDCSLQIRKTDSYIEYFDTKTQLWVRLYPTFRLYRTSQDVATLLANDGKSLTFEAGCAVTINGTNYTDFNEIFDALTAIVDFFFRISISALRGGLFANKPSNPVLFEMYFATDLNTNGYIIIWNGSVWVNASGAIVP